MSLDPYIAFALTLLAWIILIFFALRGAPVKAKRLSVATMLPSRKP